MTEGSPKLVRRDVIDRLWQIDSAIMANALSGFGTMQADIRTMTPGLKLVGPAYTVKCYPGSIMTVHRALARAKPGDVLVVDGEGDSRAGALIGELMAKDALNRGIAGVVIDGAVRDIAGIRSLQLPTFARHVTPRVGVNRRLGETEIDVTVGGVVIRSGDYLVADDDGVTVIPSHRIEQAISAADAIEKREHSYSAALDRQERLIDILGFHDFIQ